ncbi:hypothetical protein D3C77_744980 [compost metagenome]
MMRPDAKVEKVYLYPKPIDFQKSIDGLTTTDQGYGQIGARPFAWTGRVSTA